MLVLTRKIDEQILIGDDIKVTLLRVRGNTVRIGIEAPRDIRIVRGELGPEKEADGDSQPCPREPGFARSTNRRNSASKVNRLQSVTEPQIFVGTVNKSGGDARLTRAPLAAFVSAS